MQLFAKMCTLHTPIGFHPFFCLMHISADREVYPIIHKHIALCVLCCPLDCSGLQTELSQGPLYKKDNYLKTLECFEGKQPLQDQLPQ